MLAIPDLETAVATVRRAPHGQADGVAAVAVGRGSLFVVGIEGFAGFEHAGVVGVGGRVKELGFVVFAGFCLVVALVESGIALAPSL